MIELYCLRCKSKIEYTGEGTHLCPVCKQERQVGALDAESGEMHAKAEFYLSDGQYFNALKMYEILLKRDGTDTNALFGAVLSEYGANYTDNYDGSYTFTCERTHSLPVWEYGHCKKLFETADEAFLSYCKPIIDLIAEQQKKNNLAYLENAPVENSRDYRAEARASDEGLAEDYISARDKYLEVQKKEKEAAEARRLEAKERLEAAERARERRAELEKKKAKTKKNIIRIACAAVVLVLLCVLSFTFIIPEIRYGAALSNIESGNFDAAAKVFRALGSYKDSEALADKYRLFGLEVSDTVSFGKYEQDANKENGCEAIEWIVIQADESTITLISKQVLDCVPYDETKTKPSYWSSCTLRDWLGSDFASTAFSESELSLIAERANENPDNDEHKTLGCETTRDKVWVLSLDEALALDGDTLAATPTAYALARGAYQKKGYDGTNFWLRSPGATQNQAAYISYEGKIVSRGSDVNYKNYGVRVCITVNKSVIE